MSCSKPLPPFVCDSLYYLNRHQLERFSIVCRPLKNFIERYLHSKPYRVFDWLYIRGGTYNLRYKGAQWHPNQDDYSAHQFLAGQRTNGQYHNCYYSFADMRPYFGQTVRIKFSCIKIDVGVTYNLEHIEEMESIAHLWRDRKISVENRRVNIVAEDIHLIFNSPTILQCRILFLERAHFSFKDYKVLYHAKLIENNYGSNRTDPSYWPQFLEQPGAKPVVVLRGLHRESVNTVIDHLSKAFSSAVLPNAFKIVFVANDEPFTEFRKTNETSHEKLELKKGLPIEYLNEDLERDYGPKYTNYTLERSSI